MICKIIKLVSMWAILVNISACTYKKPLAKSELIVPPFIQEDHKDLYEVFQAKD